MLKALQFLYLQYLEERPKALLKMFLIENVPYYRDIIFEHVFENIFLYRCFFNIDYR